MIEDLKNATLSETEQLRQAMVDKLEGLNKELALHRKDGKLPVGVIHEMMLVNRSIIELLGIRKAVVEKLEVKKSTISFRTVIASTQKELTESKGKTFAMTTGHLALKAGEDV